MGTISLVHRYYDPATEQFLSVDPDVNITAAPYAFTSGDPVNGVDPLGLCWPNWACGIEHAVGGAATAAWNDTGGVVISYVSHHAGAIALIGGGLVVVIGATLLTGGLADAAILAAEAAEEAGPDAVLDFNITMSAHGAFIFAPGLVAGAGALLGISLGIWNLAAGNTHLGKCSP